MSTRETILVVDDEANMRHMLSRLLEREGYAVTCAANGNEALDLVRGRRFDYILCDVRMPVMDGQAFLKAIRGLDNAGTVIMMSAYGTIGMAVEAMKEGAYDFITKPFKPDEVLLALKKAHERERLRRQNQALRRQVRSQDGLRGFEHIITASPAMREVLDVATRVAAYDTTVLITGESGTGKELVARGIHALSPRNKGPFVAVNCGSVPESLIESEFFGHVKGAFTGADRHHKGLFEEADGGVLLLDEIGELPQALQVKLLRVLQEGEIRPVGSTRSKEVDVRILAATARDMEEMVRKGAFRDDLFFRINVVCIHIPPLRVRREDIPVLCEHFIENFNARLDRDIRGISPEAMNLLTRHHWPGNVRELENVMERAVILTDGEIIEAAALPAHLGGKPDQETCLEQLLGPSLSIKKARRMLEQKLITRALQAHGGNKSQAARDLEISYPSLLSKIKEYGIQWTGDR